MRSQFKIMLNIYESAIVRNPSEKIVEALRAELAEYGGLLNLFDQQDDAILNRKPMTVSDVELKIKAQLTTLRARSSHRENMVSELMPNADARPTLLQTILLFPQPMRTLVEALVCEVNRLLNRVRRRAHQNQMLLSRTIGVAREFCD